nr:MAG TPA: hypothetical protein [Caudoviricetes sp.]
MDKLIRVTLGLLVVVTGLELIMLIWYIIAILHRIH